MRCVAGSGASARAAAEAPCTRRVARLDGGILRKQQAGQSGAKWAKTEDIISSARTRLCLTSMNEDLGIKVVDPEHMLGVTRIQSQRFIGTAASSRCSQTVALVLHSGL